MLSPRLLHVLRCYARAAKPREFLFPSWSDTRHLTASVTGLGLPAAAAQRSGIGKHITAHTLRHSFASSSAGKWHRHPHHPGAVGPQPNRYHRPLRSGLAQGGRHHRQPTGQTRWPVKPATNQRSKK